MEEKKIEIRYNRKIERRDKMIKMVKNINDANAITHSGSFHADDIFATIFLSKLQDVFLFRINELPVDIDVSDKIVYDVGLKEYDHHGSNAKVRENGIKYSAFGLLFESYGRDYLKKKEVSDIDTCYQEFLKELVLQIDAIDNGVFPPNPSDYHILTLSHLIEIFNPTWKEEKTSDEAFLKAIEIGEIIFDRIEKRIIDKISAKEMVERQIKKAQDKILILDEYMPFMDFLLNSKEPIAKEILFAIFPSNRGGYNIRAINIETGNYQNRLDFPKEWGGKTKEELERLTNIKTFRFCHTNLFLASTDTLEDAIKVAKLAINEK